MHVSFTMHGRRIQLSGLAVGLVCGAGSLSLFATYWDDAWHTDIGRDDALIPPHLVLYGSVALIGVTIVAWGLVNLFRVRSLALLVRQPALLIAGLGGTATLGSAPIDAIWHSAYGRDAVLWSPPHMLAVFGTLALITGVLAGARSDLPVWLRLSGGALLLGSALVSTLEFETDVPQFAETLYLPVLITAGLYASFMVRSLVRVRHAVAGSVAVYVILRLVILVSLAALGRTAPDLPLAITGLAAIDLPWRRASTAYAAGAAGVSLTTFVAAATGLTSLSPDKVALIAVPVTLVFLAMLSLDYKKTSYAFLAVALLAIPIWSPRAANAHDPGQGEPVTAATLTATSDGRGTLAITVDGVAACKGLNPRRLVARRAGNTVVGALMPTGTCRFRGSVEVLDHGRWFLYVEMESGGGRVEGWVPIESDVAGHVVERRDLYIPAGRPEGAAVPSGEVAAGAGLYGVGLLVLAASAYLVGRSSRRAQPV